MHREPLINSAPGKELIEGIVKAPSLSNIKAFYALRIAWKSYPIFHERLSSGSLFDDLMHALKSRPEQVSACLDFALINLEEADEKYLLCAVFLLSCMCHVAPHDLRFSAEQVNRIRTLKPKMESYAFIINLASFWETIGVFAGRTILGIENELIFRATTHIELTQHQLITNHGEKDCPLDEVALRERMSVYPGRADLHYAGFMALGNDKYWMYQCTAKEDEATQISSSYTLWVHREENGNTQVFRRAMSTALRTDVLLYHFSPWEHAAF